MRGRGKTTAPSMTFSSRRSAATHRIPRPWPACAVLALAWAAAPAQADFFGLEPGARVRGHQDLDCKKCHAEGTGSGIDRNKCLGCHDHRDLRAQVEHGRGLHGRPEFQKSCEKCHVDHKGEKARVIDWKLEGGMDQFNHAKTGYELEGRHRRVKCTDCHKARFERSGTPRFLGLDQKCLSCHQDVHNFQNTRKELTDCTVCHQFDAREIASQQAVLRTFNHAAVTEHALRGAHDDIKCTKCHTQGKAFRMAQKPQGCASCHKDPHRNVYTAEGRSCEKCHVEDKASFKEQRFDHGKTRFPLQFTHARTACTKCHPKEVLKSPALDCLGCHREDNVHVVAGADRFDGVACQKCHTPQGFKGRVIFNHGQETRMKLAGRHAEVGCAGCHRGKPKAEVRTAEDTFERFKSAECIGCHQHREAHQRAFHDTPQVCTRCHVPGSDNLKLPPHDKLSEVFAQAGAHAAVSCEKCHGEGIKKLKVGADCVTCHEDKHRGTLGEGKNCKACHTEGYAFLQVSLDHDRDTHYPLTGRHASVRCARCHPGAPATYKVPEQKCVDCHGAQDVHAGKLGLDCARCHTPSGGAPRFDHARMTRFPLEGAHARAECVGCHALPERGPDGQPVVDWQFRAPGKDCKTCHGDRHGVSAASTCARCHGMEDWRTRIVDRYHDVPPFSLLGQHSDLECTKCHGQSADLTGTGTRCESCHRQDDIHGGALRECQQCHRVQGWMPSSFTHATTGFPLQGIHRTLDCRQCHGVGAYSGMSSECISCHLRDWANATSPVANIFHNAVVQDPNCLPCHNQVSWYRGPRGELRRNLR
ncbi:MAG: hypothetical protein HY904_02745 [Deltaproteobacteria bacterium]|nr:hypothetical protein [Deltaproteobacteria bacterium]